MALSTTAGRQAARVPGNVGRRVGCFQAAGVDGTDGQAAGAQRREQGGDGGDVRRQEVGAVEDDGCHGGLVQIQPQHAMLRHWLRRDAVVRRQAGQMGHQRQRPSQVRLPAVPEAGVQPGVDRLRHGGQRQQRRVVPAVTGQHRQRDRSLPAQRGQFLRAIPPVVDAAQQAQHDAAGMGHRLPEIQVHRQRMPQLAQGGQAQRRFAAVARGQRAEVGVRGRQHHQRRRPVRQVHRLRGFVERPGLAGQQVHQAPAVTMRWRRRWRRGPSRSGRSPPVGRAAARRHPRRGRSAGGSGCRRPAPPGASGGRRRKRSPSCAGRHAPPRLRRAGAAARPGLRSRRPARRSCRNRRARGRRPPRRGRRGGW